VNSINESTLFIKSGIGTLRSGVIKIR
jgi:hypothetical protein